MKTSAAFHILALAACFVVQLGAAEMPTMPGVRRAIQTMESAGEACHQGQTKAAMARAGRTMRQQRTVQASMFDGFTTRSATS